MPGQALPATTDEHAVALKQRPVVVKLGGSVVRSAELPAWLDAIAASPLPIVIVPGGGALADEVRAAQARLGFGDGAAHRMALLAMDQLAWAVAGLRAGFEVGDTEEALRASLAHGRVAVWAPYSLVAERSDIPQSWTVTSDSLALWLGRRLGAACCYVIKSIDAAPCQVRRRAASPRRRRRRDLPRHVEGRRLPGLPAWPRRSTSLRGMAFGYEPAPLRRNHRLTPMRSAWSRALALTREAG